MATISPPSVHDNTSGPGFDGDPLVELVRLSTRLDTPRDDIIQSLLEFVRTVCEFDIGLVSHVDGERYLIEFASDPSDNIMIGQQFLVSGTYCNHVIETGQPLYLTEAGKTDFARMDCYLLSGFEAFAGVPLMVDGEVYGSFCLGGRKARSQGYSEQATALVEMAGRLIAQHLAHRSAEDRFDLAVRGSQIGLWEWNLRTDEIFWSPRTMELLRVDLPDDQPLTFVMFDQWIHADDHERVMLAINNHLSLREPYDLEYRIQRSDGTWLWVHDRGQASWSSDGRPLRMAGVLDDITYRKQAETALADRAFMLQLAGETAQIGYWHRRAEDDVLVWSDELYALHGVVPGEYDLASDRGLRFCHPDDRDALAAMELETRRSRSPQQLEYRIIRPSGEVRWLNAMYRCQFDAQGQVIAVYGICQDITQRHMADESLRRSQERYRAVVAGGHIGIWDWNVVDDTRYWSPEFLEMLQIPAAEFVPKDSSFRSRVHPDEVDEVVALVEAHLRGEAEFDTQCRMRRNDDTYIWVRLLGQAAFDESGRVSRFTGSVYDITRRKLAADREAEQARMLALSGRAARLGYYEIDLVTETVEFSEGLYALYGLDPQTYTPSMDTIWELTHPADLERAQTLREHVIESGEPGFLTRRMLHADGSERLVHTWLECFFDRDGQPARLFGVSQDVTETARIEIQLREQADALKQANAELERYTAIASHDLQEPLRKIATFGDLLERRYADQLDERGREIIHVMTDGASRMRQLISDLLDYTRSSNEAMKYTGVSLDEIVEEVLDRLDLAISDIGAHVDCATLPDVRGDRLLLGQLFQNLIGNALKYHDKTRPLRVSVSAERAEDDSGWMIRVRDNGIGFSPEHAERIFTAFQRLHTRNEYPGTGMGLALCQRIVERHCGRIWAEGEDGEGACFYVYFPDACGRSC